MSKIILKDSKCGSLTFEPSTYSGILPAKSNYEVAADNSMVITYKDQQLLKVTPQATSPYVFTKWLLDDKPVTTGDISQKMSFVAQFEQVKTTDYKLAVSGSGS